MKFSVETYLNAQSANVYQTALREIQRGKKQTHWMWYIFPQMQGLGWSWMAMQYELPTIDNAKEYIANDILRSRLIEISEAVYVLNDDIHNIFGSPDDLKFKSCMTLFALISPEFDVFQRNLDKFFGGEMCEYTRNLFLKEIQSAASNIE